MDAAIMTEYFYRKLENVNRTDKRSRRMKMTIDIESAIKYLHKQYDKALKMDYIKNPLAWALYQTWKYVDKGNGARMDGEQK